MYCTAFDIVCIQLSNICFLDPHVYYINLELISDKRRIRVYIFFLKYFPRVVKFCELSVQDKSAYLHACNSFITL